MPNSKCFIKAAATVDFPAPCVPEITKMGCVAGDIKGPSLAKDVSRKNGAKTLEGENTSVSL